MLAAAVEEEEEEWGPGKHLTPLSPLTRVAMPLAAPAAAAVAVVASYRMTG